MRLSSSSGPRESRCLHSSTEPNPDGQLCLAVPEAALWGMLYPRSPAVWLRARRPDLLIVGNITVDLVDGTTPTVRCGGIPPAVRKCVCVWGGG